MLRGLGYNFLNIGYYLERADNSAGVLDMKSDTLPLRGGCVSSGFDHG